MSAAPPPSSDGLVVAKRNLIKIKRVPDLLVFTTLSPIMFVLLFAYVFGGAIDQSGGGSAYREFLIAGIFAQTVVFGVHHHRRRHRRGRPEGHHRPVPHAADVALGGALRPHAVRRGQQRHRAGGDVADRPGSSAGASATAFWHAAGGLPAAAGLRLRHLLDHGARRAAGAEPRGGQQRLVHHHLPAHLHRQHLRAAGDAARSAAHVRGVEPDLGGHPGGARELRQRAARRRALAPRRGRCRTPSSTP